MCLKVKTVHVFLFSHVLHKWFNKKFFGSFQCVTIGQTVARFSFLHLH